MTAAVRQILKKIEKLSDRERTMLVEELTAIDEREWEEASAEMRKLAKARGITQKVIDEAVASVRYGR